MNCESARQDFGLYLYGELDFNHEEALEQHLESCAACRSALEKEKAIFHVLDDAHHEPSPELLYACRRELRSRIGVPAAHAAKAGLWQRLGGWLHKALPAPAILRPAGALALLVLGFVGGKAWDSKIAWSEPSVMRVRNLSSNQDGVHLVVEEVRQRTMKGQLDDDNIHRMLLAAASDPSDPGLRARTLDVLKERGERADIRKALLQALQSDTNPGVRLKAMEALRPFASDPETRRTLSQILLTDDNPGVRTQAIDLLVQHMNPDAIGTLQELIMREENPYIRQKSAKALREMNASVETF
ncbi:MAG: HEAT repeat domain-containing protein [Bryobacterales bacterium]|nr:HEAT repeat domain-containing protein [Bryobacterales bacterium]